MAAKKTAATKTAKGDGPEKKLIASNKRARHDYFIDDTWEAGVVLTGTEVKSLRDRGASLVDGYCYVEGGEVWMDAVHIAPYVKGTWTNHAARRNRKVLLHRREIDKLERATASSGRTIVPLALYFQDGYAKVELAVGTGKKAWDKRQSIAERDANREAARALADRNRGR